MIKIINVSGRSAPVICCDICGEIIKDAMLGAAVFPKIEDEGSFIDVLHVHKGSCHDQADLKIGGGRQAPWQELRHHFSYLLYNIGLSIERLQEIERQDDMLGNL